MESTSTTLIRRLKDPADSAAWDRFVDLYAPLLLFWAKKSGLQDADAADVVQDILYLLLQKLPDFEYDGGRRFRGWLHTVSLNKIRDRFRRAAAATPAGESGLSGAVAPDDLGELWEDEYRRHLVASALALMRTDFEPATWQACWEHVTTGRSAAEVGRDLGLSEGAVYVAKSRVLRRLRQELGDLLD